MEVRDSRSGLLRGQDGQALLFGAFTLFFLVAAAALVFNVGEASVKRLRVQHAADEGAYAGALALANAASQVGWLNDAMAHLYYHAMRYAVDVNVYGTLAALKRHPPVEPSDDVVGIPDPVGHYERAYAEAATWLPRLQSWALDLSRVEYGLLIAGPHWMRREVFRAVHGTLGTDPAAGDPTVQACLFPEIPLLPSAGGRLTLVIHKLPGGWRIEQSQGSFWMEIRTLGERGWSLTTSTGVSAELSSPDPRHYRLRGAWGDWTFEFHPNLGWVLQGEFSIREGPHGGYEITGKSGKQAGEYRRGPDGMLERWGGQAWEPLSSDSSVTIDGTPIPVVQNGLTIDGMTVTFDPLTLSMPGAVVHLQPGDFWMETTLGPAAIGIRKAHVTVNGLSTETADGFWRRIGSDRSRHRLTRTGGETWWYEWVSEESLFQVEPNPGRFGIDHAILDNDPSGTMPEWAGWFNAASGVPGDYHQTRKCWNPSCTRKPTSLAPGKVYINPCPTCNGVDNDGDGETDVRKTWRDALGYHSPEPSYQMTPLAAFPAVRDSSEPPPAWPGLNLPINPPQVPGAAGALLQQALQNARARARQRAMEVRFPLPLVLTEEFFKTGIHAAVWQEGEFSAQLQADGKRRLLPGVYPLVARNGWFAVACAKAGYRFPGGDAYVYRIPDPDARRFWVGQSPQNLYEGDWEARLWAVRDALVDGDLAIDPLSGDSGRGYLWRGWCDGVWRTTPEQAAESGAAGGLLRQTFDLSRASGNEIVRH